MKQETHLRPGTVVIGGIKINAREQQILGQLENDLKAEEMAYRMGVSLRTLSTCRARLWRKLRTRSALGALKWYMDNRTPPPAAMAGPGTCGGDS